MVRLRGFAGLQTGLVWSRATLLWLRLAAEFMHILHHIHTLLSGNRCSSDKMSSFTAIGLKLVNHVYLGKQGPLPFGLVAPVQ